MELVGETCKLCLKFLQGANLASLNETMLGKLEFLQMNLDQSIEESNTVCKECEEKIENAFDFKSCLVNTESCLVPYVSQDKTQKVNLRLIIEKDGPSTSTAESFGEKEVCRLCKSFFNASSVISLSKLLKDDSMSEIFQGHIPEMDLDVTENPMVCESCQKSLVSFSTLITSWSIANGWNDDEDFKDDNFEMLQVKKEVVNDFSDSNTNSSTVEISGSARNPNNRLKQCTAATQIKTETGISDSSASVPVPNTPIKSEVHEEITDTPMEEIQLKSEEVDIKDEDGEEKHKELKKELKRKRNCERQRAYYHRQKDLKNNGDKTKKKPKTNAERQREYRQRKAEKMKRMALGDCRGKAIA